MLPTFLAARRLQLPRPDDKEAFKKSASILRNRNTLHICTFGAYTRDIYRSPIFVQQHADQQRYLFAPIDFRILCIIWIRRHYTVDRRNIYRRDLSTAQSRASSRARSGAKNEHDGSKRITLRATRLTLTK